MALSTYILLAGILSGTSANITYIYKWVDNNGVTHYSNQEPTGVKSEQIDAKTLRPKKIGTVVPKRLKEDAQEQAANTDISNSLQSKEVCSRATHNLKLLQTHTRLLQQTNNSKEPVALTEEQRQASIKREQQRINAFCKK
ncbi:DUF4124 domain-containing protein [Shewanella sp. 202IG2-18]|uniref:DUF4124 domain-containing protein n=1 Tax=Parashewanella hymeniacidonis TaxID=2807618 RepID=UPI00195FB4F5|nr:DUF4124 domain-containing protein [Parashewanella hymeniacidonis]MBM7071700.1 DUF4124 domain-containing protein [Parashewanella hymeniacidonis]